MLLVQAPTQGLRVPAFAPPTRDASPVTEEQTAAIRTGIQRFQAGDYDGAIAQFQAVIDAAPGHTLAVYELALSHWAKKDFQKAIDLAATITDVRGPDLAKVYALIGNALDHAGEPRRAIEVYTKGLEFVTAGASTLYYNMAVTHVESLKDTPAGKAALKQSALHDPNHASTHLMLAKVYLRDDLRTPGLLATGRFLVLEPASPRLQQAYTFWHHLLQGNVTRNAAGEIEINASRPRKTEDGDVSVLDLHISMSRITLAAEGHSEIQAMVKQVDALLRVYASTKPGEDAGTFLWTYYMPYFRELRDRQFVEPFVYYISQRTPFPGVQEWLGANQDRVAAFLAWSKGFAWPKPAK